jgi:hypothetical protein
MSWWQVVPAALCAAALLFLPGYLAVRCWSVTGLVAVAAAGPVSIGVVSVTAVVCPFLGVRWSVLPVLVTTAVMIVIGLLVRRFRPRILGVDKTVAHAPLRSRWILLVHLGALLIPAVLLARGLISMIGGPDHISQSYDNVFHLNAVRYILHAGNGSSFSLGGMYSDGAKPSVYPGAWHDLVSLVVQLSGVTIPVAMNVTTLVVGALLWPISCIFLTTRATGTRLVPVLLSGALSAVFGAYPYMSASFGVLYPFYFSLALLPAVLGLLAMAVGVAERHRTPRWVAGLMLVVAVPGLGFAHPSSFLALLIFAVPIFLVGVIRYRRSLRTGRSAAVRYWILVGLLLCYFVFGLVAWLKIRPSGEASDWQAVQLMTDSIGQVIAGGVIEQQPTWVVLVLSIVGIGIAFRQRLTWWVVANYLIAAVLFVVVSGAPHSEFRNFLTSGWYNDSYRLAVQLPMFGVAFCTFAAAWLLTNGMGALRERKSLRANLWPPTNARPAAAALMFVIAAAIAVAGQFNSVTSAIDAGKPLYAFNEDSPLLSPDELTLLQRLDKHVPADAKIIGNPWTGTALAYAIADRRTLTPHVGGTPPPKTQYLMDHLGDIATDPKVCADIRSLNSYYVLDFPGRELNDEGKDYPGLDLLGDNASLKLIDTVDDTASLYRITGC